MNFTAIDFETATKSPNSACSVAAVVVKDGKIAEKYSTLIRPPGQKFSKFNIAVHGITPDMTEMKRDFAGIWPDLRPFLEGRKVFAHNAPFDMGVLRASLAANGLCPPVFRYGCTVQISRKAWPELPHHKLDTVGRFLGVSFRHHDALEDATVCAAIPIAAAKSLGTADISELAAALGVKLKPF